MMCSIMYFIPVKMDLIRVSALVGKCYLIQLFNLLKHISLKFPLCVSHSDTSFSIINLPHSPLPPNEVGR